MGSNAAGVSVAITGINGGALTSYKNWVNGNSNASKSHWREGEFIAYRASVSGIASGTHTLVFTYDTVHGGGHAEDYIGSYDATETTSTAPTTVSGHIIHANNIDPCADLVAAGQMSALNCVPGSPNAQVAAPAENFGSGVGGEQGCGGSLGTYTGPTGSQGSIKFYGLPSTDFSGLLATISSDNAPSGTGQCTSAVTLQFTTSVSLTSSDSIVIAWGGHIASSANWGAGNSATSISGSPYHESLTTLDNASTGSQDRALAASAIFFIPSITTTIKDSNGNPVTSVSAGTTSVHDTATLTGASSTAGGTVTYNRYPAIDCTGTPVPQTVTVTNGMVPDSAAFTPTSSISFNATYSGDSNDVGPITSACEPLQVLAPSIKVTKAADAASVSAGTPIGFTVTVSNTGAGTATGVTLTDALPGGNSGTPVHWTIDGSTGNPLSFNISGVDGSQQLTLASQPISLGAGVSLTVHVTAATSSTNCATYNNSASVTTTNDGTSNASASEAVLCATIKVTKAADAASVSAGTPIGFTVVVSNIGAGTATGVTLTDALPGGNIAAPVHWTIDGSTGNPAAFTITGADGSQQLTLAGQPISLAAGASLTVHITAATSSTSCTTYNNSASVSTTNDGTSSASASEAVLCPAIHITKTADAASVSAGTAIGFTVTVSNTGAGTATGVTLTDALPGGNSGTPVHWSIDGSTGNPGSFSITGADGSQQLTLAGQPISLATGASLTVHVTAPTSSSSCTTYNNSASVTTTNDGTSNASASEAVLCPSINPTKTADAASVSAGTTIGFTVTVSNAGPGNATGVTVNDPLPAGNAPTPVTWIIASQSNAGLCSISGSVGSQTLHCGPTSLASGASFNVHVTAMTDKTSCAVYNNTATVTSTNGGGGSPSASETVLCPNITATKTADAASVSAGSPIGFTVTVTNNGAGDATGVTVNDPLPSGNALTPVHWSVAGQSNAGLCSVTGADGSQVLACGPTVLAHGTSFSVHVTAPTDKTNCAIYNNTANVTSTNDGGDAPFAAETVNCPSISATKAADAVSVSAGGSIGFTVTVSNAGPGDATGVVVNDPLPGGNVPTPVHWVIAGQSNAGLCSIAGTDGSQVLSCGPTPLANGASFSVHATASTNKTNCTVYNNTATVTSTNDGGASPSASETVLCPTITATKAADAASVSAGTSIGFTVTVSNNGPGDATGVTVNDPLPGGNVPTPVHWSIASQSNSGLCSITGADGSQVLSCGPAPLASGASFNVHVTASTNKANCAVYNNTAAVTSTNDGGATPSASETVLCPSILATKIPDAASVSAGDPIGFTITVSNAGPGTATGVAVNDPLPAGSGTGVSWSINTQSNTGLCSISGSKPSQLLSCGPIDLAAGASFSVHITATTSASECTVYNNTANVTTTNDGGASPSASITCNPADVHIAKTADGSPVNAGDPIGFSITVNNAGLGTAKGVTVNDPLPAGSGAGVSWSINTQSNTGLCAITGSKPSQVLNCGPIDLAAGAGFSVHITATTSAGECTVYDNTATAATTNDGGGASEAKITCNPAIIHILKKADGSPVNAGDAIGFTVTVNNSGTGVAHGVTVSDPLPAGSGSGVTWSIDTQSNTGLCSISGSKPSQVLQCGPTDVAAGASFTVHITATTSATECTAYNNTAGVTTSNDGTDSSSASITCNSASVHIVKTADAGSVNAGDPIGFLIMVNNSGAGLAHGVTVSDPLPAGSGTGVTWSIDTNPGFCSISGSKPAQVLSCGPVDLATGASFSVHITATTSATECTSYDNTANMTTTNDGTGSSEALITCLPASIHILKTADAATVNAGDAIGFTITVNNSGTGVAHGVTVSDPLPAGSGSGVTWSINTQSNTGLCSISGSAPQVLSCGPTNVAASGSFSVHITATTSATECTSYTNTASVTTTNDGGDLSTAGIVCNPASIHIHKTADAATVNAGDAIGFSITVNNSGTGLAKGVTVSDKLPAGSGSGVTWSIDTQSNTGLCSITGTKPSQVLSCGPTDLVAGASFSVHITATTSASECTAYNNTAKATTTNDGSDQSSASITCNLPHVTITKTADATSVNAGSAIGFTVTIANAGPGDAEGVTLTDALPSGLGVSWAIASQSGPVTCTIGGAPPAQSISCASFTLLAGTSQIVHVTSSTSSASCGNYNNTASFTTTNDGSGSAGAKEAVNCPTSVTTSLSGGGSSGPSITINTGTSVTDQATISGAGPAAGGTVHYQYTTDPTCATGLVDAGTVSVLAGVAGPSNAVIFNTGGKFYWIATYSGDTSTNTGGSVSACGAEVLTVLNPQVSQITPTQTTCAMFASGTASTLGSVFYATNKGTTITSDNPGVMFYWVKITVVTGGNHTYTITQSTTYAPAFGNKLFNVAAGSFAYDSNCNTLSTTLGSDPSNLTVSFKGAPGVYYIGIKYSPKSIVGSGPASTTPGSSYTYTFATTGVGGSTSTIKLTHQ